MGSSPSKLQPQPQQPDRLVIEKLRELNLRNRHRDAEASALAEKGYVFVDSTTGLDSPLPPPPPAYVEPPSQDVLLSRTSHWTKELLDDPKNRLALAAFTANDTTSIIASPSAKIADQHIFNLQIPVEGSPVTNQRQSGRCWLFASTNVFRIAYMKKYNLREFELSQAYLFFYDKLEKANYFLENVIDTLHEPLDGRLLATLMAAPVGDGGQWDMVANLVEKYGLIPHHLYPDSFNAKSSATLNKIITTKLREDTLELRALAKSSKTTSESLSKVKNGMLRQIHDILVLTLGVPPNPNQEFKWEYSDKDNKFHSVTSTPLKFAAELSNSTLVRALQGTDVNRLFSLVHDPRNEYYRLLTVSRLGNIWRARPVTYVNVDLAVIKAAAISMLKRGLPVFFGSDVGQSSDKTSGIMDPDLYNYSLGFNIDLGMSKTQRLMTGTSQMTHAMVLTAVHLEHGKPVRWRVENSWSESTGDKGYMVMTDSWFDEFTYQVVVDPSVVDSKVTDVLKQKPLVLELWDPMGALA